MTGEENGLQGFRVLIHYDLDLLLQEVRTKIYETNTKLLTSNCEKPFKLEFINRFYEIVFIC